MTQLIIQGTSLDDFLSQVNSIVTKAIEAQKETPKPIKPNYLTRIETAGKFNITLPTLNSYTRKGLIPAYRFGARVLYKESEIETALNRIVTNKFK
jgi:hypothetical protein